MISMENKKPKLIIVEGAIGSGKSSLAHNLRENMKNTTMLSLSSIGNDDKNNSYMYHANIYLCSFSLYIPRMFNAIYPNLTRLNIKKIAIRCSFFKNSVHV